MIKIEKKKILYIHFLLACLDQVFSGCLNNYEFDTFKSPMEWNDDGNWKTQRTIKPMFKQRLRDWRLEMQFTAPLAEDFNAWVVNGGYNTSGKTSIVLSPKMYNNIISNANFELNYIVTFKTPQKNHLKCAQFCGTLVDSNKALCTAVKEKSVIIPSKINNCLNNYQYDRLRSSDEWNDNGHWKTNGLIIPSFNDEMRNWYVDMEFTSPLSKELQVWNVNSVNKTKGENLVRLIPKVYDQTLREFELPFIVSFKSPQTNNYLSCVQFCGILTKTNQKLCSAASVTPTVPASKIPKCLMNYKYDKSKSSEEWYDRGWKTKGFIRPKFHGELTDWYLQIEFKAKLKRDFQAWNVYGGVETKGLSSIILKPKSYNKVINNVTFGLPYIVTFATSQGKDHLLCVQFCGRLVGSKIRLCSNNSGSITKNCLNNYLYDEGKSTMEVLEDGRWKTNGSLVPSFEGELMNWHVLMQFKAPLKDDIKAENVTGIDKTAGKKSIVLKPMTFNKVISKKTFKLPFQVTFAEQQNKGHFLCVQFCGKLVKTKESLCITPTPQTVTTQPSSIPNCLNNYKVNEFRSSLEWYDNGKWRTTGYVTPLFEGELENWYIKIEFSAPLLEDIQAWSVEGVEETRGREIIILEPKIYNKKINKRNFALTFLVTFGTAQRNKYIRCLQFCGTLSRSNMKLCSS